MEKHFNHDIERGPLASMQEYAQAFRDLILQKVGLAGEHLMHLHDMVDAEAKIQQVFTEIYEDVKEIVKHISLSEDAPFHSLSSEEMVLNGETIPAGTKKLMLHNLRNIISGARRGLSVEDFQANPQASIDAFLNTDKKIEKFVCLTSRKGITSFAFFKECLVDFLQSNTLHIEERGDWERLGDSVKSSLRFSILSHCVLEMVENAIKSYFYYEKDPETGEDLPPMPIDRPQDIHMTLELTDLAFVCTVRDTGKGIPSKDLPYLFNQGFSKTHGSGLGLSLIQRSLLLPGGSIDVTCREGEGTVSTLRLPIARK